MTSLHRRRALVLLGGAAASVASAEVLRPTQRLSDTLGPLDLESTIPESFGTWRMDTTAPTAVVNPQVTAKLEQLYSEILTRTYLDVDSGYRVMLSIAYGSDQSEGLNVHDPAVCYPAQGFSVERRRTSAIAASVGSLSVQQLEARLGATRPEPVTYWMTIGEHVFLSGTGRKLAQMRYAFQDLIPDGLVFRVSSIDPEPRKAFDAHVLFIDSLLASIPAAKRSRICGGARVAG